MFSTGNHRTSPSLRPFVEDPGCFSSVHIISRATMPVEEPFQSRPNRPLQSRSQPGEGWPASFSSPPARTAQSRGRRELLPVKPAGRQIARPTPSDSGSRGREEPLPVPVKSITWTIMKIFLAGADNAIQGFTRKCLQAPQRLLLNGVWILRRTISVKNIRSQRNIQRWLTHRPLRLQ